MTGNLGSDPAEQPFARADRGGGERRTPGDRGDHLVLGGSHFVAIAGVDGDSMLILDPANGQSVVRFGAFPGSYFGGAKQDEYVFTKRA